VNVVGQPAVGRTALAPWRVRRWSATVLNRITEIPVGVELVLGVALVAFYAQRVWTVHRDSGLFRRIGFDWGLFFGQATALRAGDVGAMYQVDRLGHYVQQLAAYTATPNVPLLEWPSPYPPILAALLVPFTLVPPPVAFGIWTVLSLVAAAHLLWRANQLLPSSGAVRLGFIFFTTLPVVQAFVLGQPVVFLASAVAECFLALRKGADFKGGLWLSVLAIKPQYGLLLGLYLIWKTRWRAVAGAMLGVAAMGIASTLAAGPGSVLDYLSGVRAMGDFRDPYAAAAEMVNWRALIVNARPSIGNTAGVVGFGVLSVATVAAIVWAARSRTTKLEWQLCAVLVGTFLVSYHSHMHGLVLLTVPLAAMWAMAAHTPTVRLAVLAFVMLPTAAFVFVTAIARGFAINYDDPLWVVWPVFNVALLALLLAATLLKTEAV
jgi:Glycosyltransferase family 87